MDEMEDYGDTLEPVDPAELEGFYDLDDLDKKCRDK